MGRKRRSDHDLPLRVYKRRGSYYFVTTEGRWLALGSDRVIACHRAREYQGTPFDIPQAFLRRLLRAAKDRARRRGRQFSLTWTDMETMWLRSRGRCEVTGIPFDTQPLTSGRALYAPSIDRKDSGSGYDRDNCRLVCSAVNVAMNQWGAELLLRIVDAVVSERKYWKASNMAASEPERQNASA